MHARLRRNEYAGPTEDIGSASKLLPIIKAVRPTALIGASAMTGVFNNEVCTFLKSYNKRPIIFALSPATKLEVSAQGT